MNENFEGWIPLSEEYRLFKFGAPLIKLSSRPKGEIF